MKRVVIYQPFYLPWIGYFDMMQAADVFVYYDDVLLSKKSWQNRNRIKSPTGPIWLSVPVKIKNRLTNYLLIKDAQIIDSTILKKHLQAIALNYKKAPFYDEIYPSLEKIMNKKYDLLFDLDLALLQFFISYLGIKTKFVKSSELAITDNDPTMRLVRICQHFKATHYLTGNAAKDYLQESAFAENNIVLQYHQYQHPVYKQQWGEFIPYLSIIDLIMNEGKKSFKILSKTKK